MGKYTLRRDTERWDAALICAHSSLFRRIELSITRRKCVQAALSRLPSAFLEPIRGSGSSRQTSKQKTNGVTRIEALTVL